MAALPPAAAVELVHNYSLIHDDIQDDDAERRHRPTVWKIWGKPQGINAGTGMRIIANQALHRVRYAGLSAEKYSAMQTILDQATLRLIEGQYMDIDFETHFDITVDDYIEMISGKTAALIACSLELGALSGCDNPITIEHFKKLGEHLGIAFQVRDDILGIWGDAHEIGKAIGNDIVRKKKSLPIIFALTHGDKALRTSLITLYEQDEMDPCAVQKVIDLLDDLQTKDYIQRMVLVNCEKAHEIVNQLTIENQAADELRSVIDFCVVRNY
jgi:geranylgeranyl diphosphate synthase type I